jgi:hypothetical protein
MAALLGLNPLTSQVFKMLRQDQTEGLTPAGWLGERKMVDALRVRLGISKSEAHKKRRTAKAASNEKIRKGTEGGDLNADQANDLASADIDDEERDRLTDEDPTARQRKGRSGMKFNDSDKMWNLRLKLDHESGARVEARIGAINKRMWHQDKDLNGVDKDRTPQQRFADAATEAILEGAVLADSSGESGAKTPAPRPTPDIAVAVHFDWLKEEFTRTASATTNTGIQLTAATIRRLACDANIIPMILGSEGEILDQGRAVRTVTNGQRRALEVRDGGCVWPGCSTPPSDCDAHHVKHWADHGPTDLANLALACHTHHRLIHEGGYQLWKRTEAPGFNIYDSAGNRFGHTQTRNPFEPPGKDLPDRDRAHETHDPPEDLRQRRRRHERSSLTTIGRAVTWNEPRLFDTA